MNPAFFRVSLALLIVTVLASGYTLFSSVSLALGDQRFAERKAERERLKQVREGNRRIREENRRSGLVEGDEGFRPQIEYVPPKVFPKARSAYIVGRFASYLWWLYIIATLGLMVTLFMLRSDFGEIDRRQLIMSTVIAIPLGLLLLALFVFTEIKVFAPNRIVDGMEFLKDKQPYTNLFIMTLSILGWMLTVRFRLENWQPIAGAAVALGIFYFLLVFSGLTSNTTFGLILAMIFLSATFLVNFVVYSRVGRATKGHSARCKTA